MAQTQARPWWEDVEHLREDLEQRKVDRRQADRDNLAARRDARARRAEELEAAREMARLSSGDAVPRRRFDRGPVAIAPDLSSEIAPQVDLDEVVPPTPIRRTVEIKGRTVGAPPMPTEREAAARHPGTAMERRRPARRPVDFAGSRPDRVALWALLMGVVLILVAVSTADASTLP